MNSEKIKFSGLFLGALLALALVVGCTRAYRQGQQNKQDKLNEQETVWQEVAPDELTGGVDSEMKWVEFKDADFSFKYPEGWFVETSPKTEQGSESRYLELKNTNKKIIFGGSAPDDYYLPGTTKINVEKYADNYYLLTVAVYQEFADWPEFFEKIYAGAINEHQNYVIPSRPEIAAAAPVTISGLVPGEPRFFVRINDKIFDFGLYYKGMDKNQALKIMNTFLKDFSF